MLFRVLLPLLSLAVAGCSDSQCTGAACAGDSGRDLRAEAAPTPDAARPEAAAADARPAGPEARPPEAALPKSSESEPNDGKTKTEFNAIAVPTQVTGAIGVADDIDLFSWQAAAGDRVTVTVKTGGSSLQPHLAVFGDAALGVPAAVSAGAGDVMAEYYVLKSGSYFVGVRDRRNVGASSAHVGGPGFTYTMTITPLTRAPIPAQVGGEVKASASPPGTVVVFSYTAAAGDDLEVTVLAQRLSPPSDLDSRLSLFHPGQKVWVGTNDNLGSGQPDSLLKGKMPFDGTYHAVVENEGTAVTNLDFALKITKK